MNEDISQFESIFVARQPVFHADETIWGYELLFRSSNENVATILDEIAATSSVIADGLTMAIDGAPPGSRVLINFPEQMLVDGAGFALPKDICVVEVLENVRPTKKALAAVRKLKEAGYTIAVDDYFGQAQLEPFLDLADIIKIDILELHSDRTLVENALKTIPTGSAILLAEKVEDLQTFQFLKELGFSLFQGFFFSKPEIIPGKKLSTNETSRLQLLDELSKPEFQPSRLAEILQSDPNLSYRLFRYINSVGFGLRSKVTSLKRAIDMLGMLQTKQWLRTAVIADMSATPKTNELAYLSVQRAKFLEGVCSLSKAHACQPETMFITGLFSLLDAMLGVSMEDILGQMPLDDAVVQGLTGESELRQMIGLVQCYERGDWDETVKRLKVLGLNAEEGDGLYVRSRAWAQQMLGVSKADGSQDDEEK